MAESVKKKFIKVERELDFYEFKRILENMKELWLTIERAGELGIELDGRQFRDGMNDMLLMLATLMHDEDNLLPYFCWQECFGEAEECMDTIEMVWNILTENMMEE